MPFQLLVIFPGHVETLLRAPALKAGSLATDTRLKVAIWGAGGLWAAEAGSAAGAGPPQLRYR